MLQIKLTSVMVDDQTKALAFYTEVLGFEKRMDFPAGEYRWITVAAPGRDDLELALEPNANPAGKAFQQAMFAQGIPIASFQSTDLDADYARLHGQGVAFTRAPMVAGPVKIAAFSDTVGNLMFASSERALAPGGRFLMVVGDLGQTISAAIRPTRSGKKILGGVAPERAEDLRLLAELAEAGKFKAAIDRIFPFDRIVDAHALVDSRRNKEASSSLLLEALRRVDSILRPRPAKQALRSEKSRAPMPKTPKPRDVYLEASLLPKRSISRTWKYAQMPASAASAPRNTQPPPAERAQLRALTYSQLMAAHSLTRAGLARHLGVSRAWVTKALRSLPPTK